MVLHPYPFRERFPGNIEGFTEFAYWSYSGLLGPRAYHDHNPYIITDHGFCEQAEPLHPQVISAPKANSRGNLWFNKEGLRISRADVRKKPNTHPPTHSLRCRHYHYEESFNCWNKTTEEWPILRMCPDPFSAYYYLSVSSNKEVT